MVNFRVDRRLKVKEGSDSVVFIAHEFGPEDAQPIFKALSNGEEGLGLKPATLILLIFRP